MALMVVMTMVKLLLAAVHERIKRFDMSW